MSHYLKQPSDIALARSGIIYVTKDLVPSAGFVAYQLDVYIWTGDPTLGLPGPGIPGAPKYSLRRFYDANENAVFDIHNVLQGEFIDIDYSLPAETTGNLVINVQCRVGFVTETGTVTYDTDALAYSNVIQVQYGYTGFRQLVNERISQYDGGFLTDLPDTLPMIKDGGYMSLFTRYGVGGTVGGHRVITDGGVTQDAFFISPDPATAANGTTVRFGVGWEELEPLIVRPSITNWYEIVLITDLPNPVTIGQPKRFELQDTCKYPVYKVDYINRYGVWDRLFFYGNSSQAVDISTNNAMRTGLYDYNAPDEWQQGSGQFVVFNRTGRDSITLNTGWQAESFNESMQQLILSERVVVAGFSVIIKDKSIRYKTALTDKLINYTIEFEFAFETINTVS